MLHAPREVTVRSLVAIAATALALLIAACGGSGDSWSARAVADSVADSPVALVLPGSPPGAGPSRLAFALFDRDGALISDASAHLRLYALDGDSGTLMSEHDLVAVSLPNEGTVHVHGDGSTHIHDGPSTTLFVASADFDRPGEWGAELSVSVEGETVEGLRLRFIVMEHSSEPMIGDPAPRSTQLTLRDVDAIEQIDSSTPPLPALHELTVAEALDTGRPLVIAFATPAFCQTRFCGPVIDAVVRPLHRRYGEQVEFLHIEPFDIAEARAGRLVVLPVMAEWGLITEPWVFVIDRSGRVAAKFEGITSVEEVEAALTPLLD